MEEEIELGWLSLSGKSTLVLTTLHVCQQQDRGIFGESQTSVPRSAITTVRISWQRSRALVLLGTILLVIYLLFMTSSNIPGAAGIASWEQALNLSSSLVAVIQYGLLAGSIGIFVLFWFYKASAIEIVAPSATLGGIPRSYEEAEKFWSLLVSQAKEQPETGKNEDKATPNPEGTDHDWRL
jgi:hypothetical protein